MIIADLGVKNEQIAAICRRWKIEQLAVFGSAARDALRQDSDIDLLVTFGGDADWSLFDHYRLEGEFVELFGREVDLTSRKAVEENPNSFCRREILDSVRVIYAA